MGFAAVVFVSLIAFLSGCASTEHVKGVQGSGFLGEYASLLRPDGEDGAGRLYRNPDSNWAAYRRILLEPVAIWGDTSATLSNGQHEDLQRLADSFYHTLALKLSKDYELVDRPISSTLRIQAAMSYGEGARTEQMFMSKVIPQAQGANLL